CPWNGGHTNRAAFVVQLSSGAIAAGCQHNGCVDKDWAALRDLVEPGWRYGHGDPARRGAGFEKSTEATAAPVLVRLADVAPSPVQWLGAGRVARGKLALLVGDPGLGKSALALDVAARVTVAADWPAGGGTAKAGTVVILSAEDGLADTIRPRL